MSDDLVKQAMAELTDVVRCRCNEAYTGRGLHDPYCQCDSAEAVKVVADRIQECERAIANMQREYDKRNDRIKELEDKLKEANRLMELSIELANWSKNKTLFNDVVYFVTKN